ncbi:hypothetical protein BGX38DRAFT_1276874 [Terfezia claveryi]|nr:hypothetical protein BGX38DRAFT_1276874 [Terfezia claveryi]
MHVLCQNLAWMYPQPHYVSLQSLVVIREQVDKFVFGGRSVGDSLSLVITPTVFDELCLHLDAKARYTYDYSSRRLVIHGLPTYYHEISDPIITALLQSFDTHLMPEVNRYMTLANLTSRIVWHGGGPSIRMVDSEGNKKAEKVPDASVRMRNRPFPTVVVEVGKTQSLRSLRAAAKLWFAHALEIPGTTGHGLNMRNLGQREKPSGVELVILVDFAKGGRTQEDVGDHDGEEEVQTVQYLGANRKGGEHSNAAPPLEDGHSHPTEPSGKDFTHVYIELWRCCNPSYCRSAQPIQHMAALPPSRQTRSSMSGLQPKPHMCQRLQIYPPLAPADQGIQVATFYLTDFVGSDSFEDPTGRMHMDVPLQIFGECVETISSYILSVGQERGAVIRMDDLENERVDLEQSIPAPPPRGNPGKENVTPLETMERVLVEKVNFIGEDVVGRRRKAANMRLEVDREIEQGEEDWEGSGAVKRRRV